MFGYQQMKDFSDIQLMNLEDLLHLVYGWESCDHKAAWDAYKDAAKQLRDMGIGGDVLEIMSTIHNIQFDRLEISTGGYDAPCSLSGY